MVRTGVCKPGLRILRSTTAASNLVFQVIVLSSGYMKDEPNTSAALGEVGLESIRPPPSPSQICLLLGNSVAVHRCWCPFCCSAAVGGYFVLFRAESWSAYCARTPVKQ